MGANANFANDDFSQRGSSPSGSAQHCPFCNGSRSVAMGAVAYAECVLVEHRCTRCGHLFCIGDRRGIASPFSRVTFDERFDSRTARRA